MAAWENLSFAHRVDLPMSVKNYASKIASFNCIYRSWKAYEDRYCSDMAYKTLENARELNRLSEELDDCVKTLPRILVSAQTDFRDFLKARAYA